LNELKGGYNSGDLKGKAEENYTLHTKLQTRDIYDVNKISLSWTGQTFKELKL